MLTEEKERLFKQFRNSIGAGIRSVEITDEQLCTALELAIEDYAERVQNWLIEHQWQSILGKNLDTFDISFALTVRDIDYVTQHTYAYSKQVGLQQRGPWELKKDYVTIEDGRQVYEIPAGREINEVLWITPNAMNRAIFSNYGGVDVGFGGGFGSLGTVSGGFGGGIGTMGGMAGGAYYIAPAVDIALAASDLGLKDRMLRSELAYKVTAGPNGTRLLHLMSTPGSRFTFGRGLSTSGAGQSYGLQGCQVWYFYYDTTPENLDECRKENKDIIKLPNEVPLSRLEYSEFNEPTKVLVRQIFFARAKQILAHIRGRFGGVIGPPGAERTMNFQMLIDEAKEEKEDVFKRIDERLERLSTLKQLERAASEAEFINKAMKYRPLGFYTR